MSNVIDQVVNHLEFLGYKIEKIEPKKEGDKLFVLCRHPKRNNIVFFHIGSNLLLFQVSLNCEKKVSPEMFDYMNKVNNLLNVSRVFCLEENGSATVRFEATYTGNYSKEIFAEFLDLLETDQQRFNALDNFDSIFLK